MRSEERSRTSGGGGPGSAGPFTPGRIVMSVVAALTLVLGFENAREAGSGRFVPEVTMPLCVALLATALLGTARGYRAAARRRG